ncbi:hypothetical protein GCM10010330_24460 [Streptomyces tendae]|nr:hypothetical protein GCM10010330_24460 [Streptomyces tendae]
MFTSSPKGVPTGGWKPYKGTSAGPAWPWRAGCRLSTIMCPQPTVRFRRFPGKDGLCRRTCGSAHSAVFSAEARHHFKEDNAP